jgi:hypothetical protein
VMCPAFGVRVALPVLLGADRTCVYVIIILVSWGGILPPICAWLGVLFYSRF